MNILEKDKNFSKFFHVVIDSGTWSSWSFKAKAVYPVLNRWARYDSRKALPTVETISKLAGITEDSVREGIKEIVKAGYADKRRGNARVSFRNIYTIFKEPQPMKAIIESISRKKPVKCKTKRDPHTGKFIPSRKNHGDCSRNKTVDDISRKNHGKKKNNIEILNRDIATDSASACIKSQASPVSTVRCKSLGNISNETLVSLKDVLGSNKFKGYLLENGYSKDEVEKLRFLKKSDRKKQY